MSPLKILVALTLAVLAASAAAQVGGDSNAARIARASHRDAQVARGARASYLADTTCRAETDLTFGAAYDRPEGGGRAITTPFSLQHQTGTDADHCWKFEAAGDGYSWSNAPGQGSESGLSDLVFNVYRPIASSWTGMLGIGVPTRGHAGSTTWAQVAKLAYVGDIVSKVWTYTMVGTLTHQPNDMAGQGSLSERLRFDISRNSSNDEGWTLSLSRSHQSGASGSTELGLERDFILAKALNGALILGRGLAQGSRHTAVEFDVTHMF